MKLATFFVLMQSNLQLSNRLDLKGAPLLRSRGGGGYKDGNDDDETTTTDGRGRRRGEIFSRHLPINYQLAQIIDKVLVLTTHPFEFTTPLGLRDYDAFPCHQWEHCQQA